MFEKNYKDAMDNICPSDDVKERIFDKIELKENLKSHKNPAVPWRIAFACAACVAIVLGVLFAPRNATEIKVNSDNKVISAAKGYTEIYKILKKQKLAVKITQFSNALVGDFAVDEEIVYQDNIVDDAKPGDAEYYSTNNKASGNDDYSNTTEQVEGVSEADIVKTDGKYIYYLSPHSKKICVFSAQKENSEMIGQIDLSQDEGISYGEMFIKDNRLILLQTNNNCVTGAKLFSDTDDIAYQDNNIVSVLIYDISDPAQIKQIASSGQQGWYNTARMVGDYVYLISNCNINLNNIERQKPSSFVPTVVYNGTEETVPADSIYRYNDEVEYSEYAVIGAYNYKDGTLTDSASILGGADQIYCSQGNIILAKSMYHNIGDKDSGVSNTTQLSRLEIKEGNIEYKASGEIDGVLENQFFIDEHKGYFRFVTTVSKNVEVRKKFENYKNDVVYYQHKTVAQLTVLDSSLKKTGEITDLAPDERVYSVRFMGDIAYFVTFRQVDPLFSADLSDPANPKIIGELKIPGFSEYMYPYGDGKLLGFGRNADEKTGRTDNLKLSMFDISDPANVTENNKTIIDGYTYSPALYNHKAMMVSTNKNLIGFSSEDMYGNHKYLIYEYQNNAFVHKATLDAISNSQYIDYDSRGLFVNDGFYLVLEGALKVYDINTFLSIKTIDF